MSIYEHMTTFVGQPIIDWAPGHVLDTPATTVPRIGLSYDDSEAGESWAQRLHEFLDLPATDQITGLVVGPWSGMLVDENTSDEVVEALVARHEHLPNLRAIFLGDITMEESEISWIQQGDLSPLFAAFPALEYFGVRGANGLSLGRLRLQRLQTLVVQSGGLPSTVVREVAAADLPALTHLELWLGTLDYGGDASVDDLAPLLAGDRFPALQYLGLRNSESADDVARAVASAPILERIQVLDLSLGNLSDDGLNALLESPAVRGLQKLDIHHHFCTPEAIDRLEALGIAFDASEPQEPDEYNGTVYRYISVSE